MFRPLLSRVRLTVAAMIIVLCSPAVASPATAEPAPRPTTASEVTAAYQLAACDPSGATSTDAALATQLNGTLRAKMRGYMSAYRVSCARMVIKAVHDRGLDPRAAVIAIATTIVETSIQNISEEVDHDSLGLFQQRASWGTAAQRLNPTWATNAFLDKMLRVYPNNSWKTAPIGQVCQAVQVSAYPDRYQEQAADAQIIVNTVLPHVSGPKGTASVYGVLPDGRLTYSAIDAATGQRTKTVVSTATLGFTPKAMATLNFNTILITEDGPDGKLYRIDVITNKDSLAFNPPLYLGGGWTHDLLAYDGNTHLFGIAGGVLRRYIVNTAKPAITNISAGSTVGSGFTLKTLTTTASNWLLGTTATGLLISYRIDGTPYTRHQLRDSTWQVFDHLISPGGGVYYGHRPEGSLHRYLDTDPHDDNGDDITAQGTVDTSGWTQTLLSAQPATVN
ncbi:hypothetical protein ACFYSC_36810 [Streptosporangium sp. NPDC004379]|uniref:hypothetical protein n=1 Tax=Streptosporangium sp. NPDC004379 TaxID=3366189 RepID=UPI00367B33BB